VANRNYETTYESVLAEILAGRELTASQLEQVQQGSTAYGRELRELHEAAKGADTSKPGWVSRLLGGG
jgi:Ser/Thr protein kinase RdoA (MazF antagonist)